MRNNSGKNFRRKLEISTLKNLMLLKYVKKPFSNPVKKIPKIQNIGFVVDIYCKGLL
jgi:hypothetical protein